MVPAGNKAKRLSSVNYTTKTIHHQVPSLLTCSHCFFTINKKLSLINAQENNLFCFIKNCKIVKSLLKSAKLLGYFDASCQEALRVGVEFWPRKVSFI